MLFSLLEAISLFLLCVMVSSQTSSITYIRMTKVRPLPKPTNQPTFMTFSNPVIEAAIPSNFFNPKTQSGTEKKPKKSSISIYSKQILDPSFAPSKFPSMATTIRPTEALSHSPLLTVKSTTLPSPTLTRTPTFLPSPSKSISAIPSLSRSPTTSFIPSTTVKPTTKPLVTRTPTTLPSSSYLPSKPFTSHPSSMKPTARVTISVLNTFKPQGSPMANGVTPTVPTRLPSITPSLLIKAVPTASPSWNPSKVPSVSPSFSPSKTTTVAPTLNPSKVPSVSPSSTPSKTATVSPSLNPSKVPSVFPSPNPSKTTTVSPSLNPSKNPTILSTQGPTDTPTFNPTSRPPNSLPPRFAPTPSPITAPSYPPSLAPTLPKTVTYHNGTVMTGNVNLYIIYYGRFDPKWDGSENPNQMKSLMNYFASQYSSLPWFSVLSQYYQYIDGVKTYAANNVTYKQSVNYATGAVGKTVTQDDMITAINSSISTSGIPLSSKLPLDPNGIYTVIFRGDFIFDGWMTQWCGFHGTAVLRNLPIKFAIIGDPSTTVDYEKKGNVNLACSGAPPPTVNRNFGADSMVSVFAHEIAESITDGNNDGWYIDGTTDENPNGVEIADLCAWKFGDYNQTENFNVVLGDKKFLVQKMFQRDVGCVLYGPNAPTPVPTVSPPTGAPLGVAPSGGHSGGQSYSFKPTYQPVQLPTTAPNMNFDLSYHGGAAVLGTYQVDLIHVYFGGFSNDTVTLLDYFASTIGNSPWYNILTSFYEFDADGYQNFVTNVTNYDPTSTAMLYPAPSNGVLTDEDIQLALFEAIQNNTLTGDSNAVYTVMFRGDYNVSYQGKYWLKDWCSYHGTFALPSGDWIKYAVIGDPSTVAPGQNGAVCEAIYGVHASEGWHHTANANRGADSIIFAYGQQLANLVTDFDGAWYSESDGSEVGSACIGDTFSELDTNWNVQLGSKYFLLPKLWQPAVGCKLSLS